MTGQLSQDLFERTEWLECERRVIEAAGGSCEDCGVSTSLRVHHAYSEKDRLPWDYPPETLHALCENCKRDAEDQCAELSRQINQVEYAHCARLLGYAQALEAADRDMVIRVRSYEHAQGIADATGVFVGVLLGAATEEHTISSEALAQLRQTAPRPQSAPKFKVQRSA